MDVDCTRYLEIFGEQSYTNLTVQMRRCGGTTEKVRGLSEFNKRTVRETLKIV